MIHHVCWVQRRHGSGGKDGEADFLIVHPERGVLVMEVIGGDRDLVAKAVVVCEVQNRRDPAFQQLMYVACSRARSMLVVLETE